MMIDHIHPIDAIDQAECSGGIPVPPPVAAGADDAAQAVPPAALSPIGLCYTPAAVRRYASGASTVADSSRGCSSLPPGFFLDCHDDDPGDCSDMVRRLAALRDDELARLRERDAALRERESAAAFFSRDNFPDRGEYGEAESGGAIRALAVLTACVGLVAIIAALAIRGCA